jgi:hypothetical protein
MFCGGRGHPARKPGNLVWFLLIIDVGSLPGPSSQIPNAPSSFDSGVTDGPLELRRWGSSAWEELLDACQAALRLYV